MGVQSWNGNKQDLRGALLNIMKGLLCMSKMKYYIICHLSHLKNEKPTKNIEVADFNPKSIIQLIMELYKPIHVLNFPTIPLYQIHYKGSLKIYVFHMPNLESNPRMPDFIVLSKHLSEIIMEEKNLKSAIH